MWRRATRGITVFIVAAAGVFVALGTSEILDWLTVQTVTGLLAVVAFIFGILSCTTAVTIASLLKQIKNLGRARTWSDALEQSRTKAVSLGFGLLALAIGVHVILTGRLDGGGLLIAALAAAIASIDLFLLSWRSSRGLYGDNRGEAEELLRYISRHSKGGDPDLPRRAVRDPLQARDAAKGAVAGAIARH